ncbi:MAG TPA: aminotransferase class I/II-fold pyridoxal phosphate-dependent enzyme [Spirochaetota bacterium]|nr:aminotransferase class I/II-fold pyridoxal phosphate-dependent enzyme [Spirochaetota bacterium]
MSLEKLKSVLAFEVYDIEKRGTAKSAENIVTSVIRPSGGKGTRYTILDAGKTEFLRMNSNSYLGMSIRDDVINAGEEASKALGAGPGGVRFICGTYSVHRELEARLARFHKKGACILFSSAYMTSLGVITSLTTEDTVLISDELNHNCIINAMKLSRPAAKFIYKHNNLKDLEEKLEQAAGAGKRCLVITDGVFSMRGDYAPLGEIKTLCSRFDDTFDEGIVTIVDDSHGVGILGASGRGTEEESGGTADILIGTLGKAFGVNGGYVVSGMEVVHYLREIAPMYIYSNPITVAEAASALKVLDILESPEGGELIKKIRKLTLKLEQGITGIGFKTIEGPHPVVPLVTGDTELTRRMVEFLKEEGILATGIFYPVVPRGSEEIRFQVNGDHTEYDIDYLIDALKRFQEQNFTK